MPAVPHRRVIRALTETLPLLTECRTLMATFNAPKYKRLVGRIDYRMAQLKRMGVVK